ncbi:response regulator [Salmonella enterica]|nr:two-component system response regulator QseB [Salmonella enterica]
MRILLLEDDALIGDGIKNGLQHCGFCVDWLTDGLQGRQALASVPFDAVILDLGLPGLDGLDILNWWRQRHLNVPVLILTARDALHQRVQGLNAGADDYMAKPFALAELVARLHALIRRSHAQTDVLLRWRNVTLDCHKHQAWVDEKPVVLTMRELALMELFLMNKGRIMSRAVLEEKLYSWDSEVGSNVVEVFVHHLRRKFGNQFIYTARGLGYRLGDEADE